MLHQHRVAFRVKSRALAASLVPQPVRQPHLLSSRGCKTLSHLRAFAHAISSLRNFLPPILYRPSSLETLSFLLDVISLGKSSTTFLLSINRPLHYSLAQYIIYLFVTLSMVPNHSFLTSWFFGLMLPLWHEIHKDREAFCSLSLHFQRPAHDRHCINITGVKNAMLSERS